MIIKGKKIPTFYLVVIFLLLFALLSYVTINKFQKRKEEASVVQQISINLITSVHPSLSWNFKPVKPKIKIRSREAPVFSFMCNAGCLSGHPRKQTPIARASLSFKMRAAASRRPILV